MSEHLESEMRHRVLVTGGAGAIGRVVCRRLRSEGHWVRSFDRVPAAESDVSLQGDLMDDAALEAACDGVDTVIHLAATTDDADFLMRLLPSNVIGLHHVMEAAVHRKVRRVVLASSIQVVGGVRGPADRSLAVSDGTCACNHYAATKVLAEEFAKLYARRHKLSTLAARIGWFTRNAAECAHMALHRGGQDIYLSHRDAASFFLRAVVSAAPAPGEWAILFATSRPVHGKGVDLEAARALIGYEPQDAWPSGTQDAGWTPPP